MASEIKKLPTKMKAAIGKAGFKSPVINKETHATIKSDLWLSWNPERERKLRRYLKTAGIEQEGEHSERKYRTEKLGDHLKVEDVTLEVVDFESRISNNNRMGN